MTPVAPPPRSTWRTPMVILAAGSMVLLLVFGLRASLGLYLKPMSVDLGWGRETFAFALAMQNLLWGAFQPFSAAIAEKWGAGRVIAAGGLLYAGGLWMMSTTADPLSFQISAGLLLGMAQAGGGTSIVLGAVGRAMPAERRSWAMGLITAAGAAGQFTVVPLGQAFLNAYGWPTAFVLLAVLALAMVLCAPALKGRSEAHGPHLTAGEAAFGLVDQLKEASRHRGFWLLTAGFFVCGFHVAFIAVHMPAYITDLGLPAGLGAWSLSLIGLFNVIGSYGAGVLGGKGRKKHLLSYLYLLRAVAIALFLFIPASTTTVLAFSVAMGLLWLSTVPLTSGLVAQIFGVRYMGTLFGIVFFSHQIGSFLGVWLGGKLYDTTGSYDGIWWAGIALGIAAAIVHWPIDDKQVDRLAEAEA
ncbi:MAG: MFS transporter [Hyphomicrobiales bacterium]|nr:MFS transporter [Hyphomicrobiales bacterium]MCP5374165.1 MFS transporter [Hyphomicrobiales bacterium]